MISIDLRLSLTSAQRTAWATIGPILHGYLRKIFRVYRQATPEQRADLLAHNAVLAAIVDALDEDN